MLGTHERAVTTLPAPCPEHGPGLTATPPHPRGSLGPCNVLLLSRSPLFTDILTDNVLLSSWHPQAWCYRDPKLPVRKWGSEKVTRLWLGGLHAW